MNEGTLVSVIMASYNHAPYIGAAVESVQRQSYPQWELLIADDGSTDNTAEVLGRFADDGRIKVFEFQVNREEHMRNFAAARAKGEYLAFLNSDDLWHPEKLSRQVRYLQEHPDIEAVFTAVNMIDEDDAPLVNHPYEKLFDTTNRTRHQWLRRFFLYGNCLCISSAVIRRSTFDRVSGFNPLLVQVSDLDLWVKTCFSSGIHVIGEPLTAMRILPGERNLSSGGPANRSRSVIEWQQVMATYFQPDGLTQTCQIFPELAGSLPDDTLPCRRHMLCQLACGLPYHPMRIAGFQQLSELLKDRKAAESLRQQNRRLMRSAILSEGAASLDADRPGITWRIWWPDPAGAYSHERSYAYWTCAADRGVACFSFPNPHSEGVLRVSTEGIAIPPEVDNIGLYDRTTAKALLKLSNTWNTGTIDIGNVSTATIGSGWIDIEISYSCHQARPESPVTPKSCHQTRPESFISKIMGPLRRLIQRG